MFKIFALIALLALPVLFFLYVYDGDTELFPQQDTVALPTARIGEVPLRIEVASTPEARTQGLSGRADLHPTQGMLFVFDASGYHQIWMKDMLIPIDVIWIDASFRVVDITRNLRPESYPRLFEPSSPAHFAIEVNANYTESFGIAVGDEVTLPRELIPEDLRR